MSQPAVQTQEKKPNDIRIGMSSRVSSIIRYCNGILKENKTRSLNFSAVGPAITTLVNSVEALKIVNPGLYQVSKLGTVAFVDTKKKDKEDEKKKLYPKMEVVLSLDPLEKCEGYQEKYSEEERLKLFELFVNPPRRRIRRRRMGERGGRPRARTAGFRGKRRQGNSQGRNLKPGFRGRNRPTRGNFRGASRRTNGRGGRRRY